MQDLCGKRYHLRYKIVPNEPFILVSLDNGSPSFVLLHKETMLPQQEEYVRKPNSNDVTDHIHELLRKKDISRATYKEEKLKDG